MVWRKYFPAAYVSSGCEVLNEPGQVVRVVPPSKTDTDFERDAPAARVALFTLA